MKVTEKIKFGNFILREKRERSGILERGEGEK